MNEIEKKLKLELTNIFGGDGFTYIDTIEELKLKRSKKRTTRRDVGVPQEKMFDEENREIREIEVNTFKNDSKGNYILRLGGPHGKFWGSMKAAGHILCETEGTPSKAAINRIMETVTITPDWVVLELNGSEIKREGLAQVLNTIGKSQVVHFFDVIPKCNCELTVKYPSAFEKTIKKQLEYLQSLNTLNKRRSRIKILN